MKVKVQKNIYIVSATSQYELAISFLRLQEFYESSFPEICGHYFTTEQYMDRYAEEFGNFTYTSDWNGFNIPGDVVEKFFKVFGDDLTNHEKELRKLLVPALNPVRKVRFYVIGVHGNDVGVVDHETAHALFYLSSEFNKSMTELIDNIHPIIKKRIFTKLKKMGYGENVLIDEAQAYLSTSSLWYILRVFKTFPVNTVLNTRKVLQKFKNHREVAVQLKSRNV